MVAALDNMQHVPAKLFSSQALFSGSSIATNCCRTTLHECDSACSTCLFSSKATEHNSGRKSGQHTHLGSLLQGLKLKGCQLMQHHLQPPSMQLTSMSEVAPHARQQLFVDAKKFIQRSLCYVQCWEGCSMEEKRVLAFWLESNILEAQPCLQYQAACVCHTSSRSGRQRSVCSGCARQHRALPCGLSKAMMHCMCWLTHHVLKLRVDNFACCLAIG